MTDMESVPLSRRVAALVGLLAVAAALAGGHLVAGIVDPDASPLFAVGNSVRDLSPASVTEYAIADLGDLKKPLLFAGIGVVLLVVALAAGLLSRRSPWPGMIIATLVGLAGLLAVLTQPTVGPIGVLAPIASLAGGVLTFRWLHSLARLRIAPPAESEKDEGHPATGRHPSRRRFLFTSLGVTVAAGAAGGAGQLLASRIDVESSRAAVGRLVPAKAAPPIPDGADFRTLGTPPFITPTRDFYRVDTALVAPPKVRAEDWQLRIHGMVDRERTYSFDDIRDRDLVERTITMTCVSNEVGGPYVSTTNFIGVPLRDLLDEAGVRPGADQLFSTSVDGWTAGTPTEAALDPDRDALLAIGMNRQALPVEHGFPARLVVPGLYGFVSATKWVVDLELTTFDAKQSYWLKRDWGQRAPIKTQSRIDTPRGFATFPAGRPVTVAGVAWAQHTGIDQVHIRLDGGPWQRTTLSREVNDQTWRMWHISLDAEPGTHTVEVRATDRDGETQPPQRVPPIPDGATGWHSTQFTVH